VQGLLRLSLWRFEGCSRFATGYDADDGVAYQMCFYTLYNSLFGNASFRVLMKEKAFSIVRCRAAG
jgi:hypothetical protein